MGGGNPFGGIAENTVYYAPILGSGMLGTWTATTNSYPINSTLQSCVTASNTIYCMGGITIVGYSNATYYAPILGSGDLGAWTATTNSYPQIAHFKAASRHPTLSTVWVVAILLAVLPKIRHTTPILGSGDLGAWTSA